MVRPARGRVTAIAAVLFFVAPLVAEAQNTKVWRIGYLTPVIANGNPRLAAFQQRLRELGYVEPQNVVLDIRSADGNPGRYPDLAADLVRLKVDVIVADGRPSHRASDEVLLRDQPQNRESARPQYPAMLLERADEVIK